MPDPTPIEQIEAALADLIDAYADLRGEYLTNAHDEHRKALEVEIAALCTAAQLVRKHRDDVSWLALPSWRWHEWEARKRGITERLDAAADLLRNGATLTNAAKISSPESTTGAAVRATTYTVSCLPEDHDDLCVWSVFVEYAGRGRWAVRRMKRCYDIDGEWDWESIPSERTEEWLARFRFDLDTALDIARRVAPTIRVNGRTAQDILAQEANRA
ncbi:hypothetical protein [Nocardia sp. N2S4-5]|uniref:hypothetical protein n=1 Tax=Nocardia sp. N2S4-5 TaxID=3351565 RepID=UPI0037D855ED